MNKMYEAPKAEMIQINVNKSFMTTGVGRLVLSHRDHSWDRL